MSWVWFAVAGFASGILSGMGMGGGTILIPMLTIFLGVGQHAAQGLNMLAFLPGALLAIFVHKRNGRIDVQKGKPLLLWGIAGAIAGAMLATFLKEDWLKRAFGVFLIILALVQWRKAGKRKKDSGRNLK